MTEPAFQRVVPTPIGPLLVSADRQWITHVQFMDSPVFPASTEIPEHLAECLRQLQLYFNDANTVFSLPLAPAATPFQQQVRDMLNMVKPGDPVSYKWIAQRLGQPEASRAVGMALGKNPLLVVVPCHRVVGSGGSLTGFAGGIERKRWLLEHERQAPLLARPGV